MPEAVTKAQIINHLAAAHGYRRYLELCSISTGGHFAELDRSRLTCDRLMYLCPDDYSDGFNIDYRSPNLDISACIEQIKDGGLPYDVALVDPWHEYEHSRRDIETGFSLLAPGGTMVVHDCLPPNEATTVPHYIDGAWCGVTYKAFVDFVTGRDDISYYTVDTDFGCGIVRKLRTSAVLVKSRQERDLISQWNVIGDDFTAAYRFFEEHHRTLLRLMSPEDFIRIEVVRT